MNKMINEWSIKYHKKRLKDFWTKRWHAKRHLDWWIAAMYLHMIAGTEARLLIKDMTRVAVIDKRLSVDDACRIWDLIQSPDIESKYLGLSLLQRIYPHKFSTDPNCVEVFNKKHLFR